MTATRSSRPNRRQRRSGHTRQPRSVPAMSDTTITPEHTEDTPNERRALLRKLAIGGASAAAGAVLLNHGTASAADEPAHSISAEGSTNTQHDPDNDRLHDPVAPRTAGASVVERRRRRVPVPTHHSRRRSAATANATIPNGVHGSTTSAPPASVSSLPTLHRPQLRRRRPGPDGLAVASAGRRPDALRTVGRSRQRSDARQAPRR